MKAKLVKSMYGGLRNVYETDHEGVTMWFDEIELEVAARRFANRHDIERLGDRYYSGRPTNLQDSVRHARISHQRLMRLRDQTVRRECRVNTR